MIVQLFLNGCLELNVRDSAVLWCSNCHTRFDESSRVGSIALPVEDGVMGHVMCMRCLKNQARNFGENASYHAYSVVLNPAVRLWIERYKQAYYAKLAAIEAPNDSVAEADLF